MFVYELFDLINNSKNNNEKIIRIANYRIIVKYDEDVFYIYVDYFKQKLQLINIITLTGNKEVILKNITISNNFDKLIFLSDSEIIIYDVEKLVKNKILKTLTNIPHNLESINNILSINLSDKYIFIKSNDFVNVYNIYNNKFITMNIKHDCYINSSGIICEFLKSTILKINTITDETFVTNELEIQYNKSFFKTSSDGKILLTNYIDGSNNYLKIIKDNLIYNYKTININLNDILIIIEPQIINTNSYLIILWNTKEFKLRYFGITSQMKLIELGEYNLLQDMNDEKIHDKRVKYISTNNKYIFYEFENNYLQINCKFAFDYMSNVIGIISLKSEINDKLLDHTKKELIVTNKEITKIYNCDPFIVNMFNNKLKLIDYIIFDEQIYQNAQLIDIIFALFLEPIKHLYKDYDIINVLDDNNKLLTIIDILNDITKNIINNKFKIYYKLVFRQFIMSIIKNGKLQNDIKKLKIMLNNI